MVSCQIEASMKFILGMWIQALWERESSMGFKGRLKSADITRYYPRCCTNEFIYTFLEKTKKAQAS